VVWGEGRGGSTPSRGAPVLTVASPVRLMGNAEDLWGLSTECISDQLPAHMCKNDLLGARLLRPTPWQAPLESAAAVAGPSSPACRSHAR